MPNISKRRALRFALSSSNLNSTRVTFSKHHLLGQFKVGFGWGDEGICAAENCEEKAAVDSSFAAIPFIQVIDMGELESPRNPATRGYGSGTWSMR